jgi:hypothetical protein
MKSPVTIKTKSFADVDLAYRRIRDDVLALEKSSYNVDSNTEMMLKSMRRVLVQAVLADRYVGTYIDGSLEEAETITYTPVSTAADLHTVVRGNLNGRFHLTADIDMTAGCLEGGDYYNGGSGWQPIGFGVEHGDVGTGFKGIFDGGGHKITGLKVSRSTEDYCGLFGLVSKGGIVKNLEMVAVDISGKACCGGICGGSFGLIYNCHTTGASSVIGNYTSLSYSGNVGGVIGDNDGIVRLCSATGTVRGLRDVGGVCGDNDGLLMYCWFVGYVYCSVVADAALISGDNKGFIEDVPMADMPVNKGTVYGCYGVGTVSSFNIDEIGSPAPTGNIALGVGDNRGGKCSCSWATGTVSGKNPDLGGFVGNNDIGDNGIGETKDSIVSNCYAIATVTPLGSLPLEGAVGGFAGKNKGGQIYNCFCSSVVNGTHEVDRAEIYAFCGNNSNDDLIGTISNCYFDVVQAGALVEGDEDGLSQGKTPAELYQQATFEGWDFEGVWSIVEGVSFPTLPDMPEASESDAGSGFVDVFPIQRIGVRPLTGDVRPKIIPTHVIYAQKDEDDITRTPITVEDMNFPVTLDDMSDKTGGSILGEALDADSGGNIDVQYNDTYIHTNDENQLTLVDKSIGESKLSDDLESSTIHFNSDKALSVVDGSITKEKLGDKNGGDIAGDGLGWSGTVENLEVKLASGGGLDFNDVGEILADLGEIDFTGFDFTLIADESTIGFDNPKAYVASKAYDLDEKCSDGGVNYVSIQAANTGHTPASSATWWTSIGTQKTLKIKEGVPGDGLQWSTKGKIEINQGVGLDINGSNELVVDLSEIANPVLAEVTLSNLTVSMPVKTDANKLLVSGAIVLTSDVSGVLPYANGGRGYRIDSTVSRTTLTPNFDNYDMHILTAQAADFDIANPGGTPVNGFKLIIRIKDDNTHRHFTWGNQYRGVGVVLPLVTVATKSLYIGLIWNEPDDKFDAVAVSQEI